ncbi:MAG: hemagglutinin repeat-containing protein, partial [Rhodospirillales bacterium]|nr:hemagglutinin repeat-containing protein [Rhodospirillales bacterium]
YLKAGHDVNVIGASVSAGQDAVLIAQHNVNVKAVALTTNYNGTGADGLTHTGQTQTALGSGVSAGGDVAIRATNDVNLAGAAVGANGTAYLNAQKGNVNVGALATDVYAETSSSSDLPPVAGSKLLVSKTGSQSLPSFATYTSIVASAYPHPDNCATERKDLYGNADFSADGPDTVRADKAGKQYYALVNRDNRLSGSGMNKCPDAKLIPLTTDEGSLLNSIKAFKANGYTAGAIAVQWTYYMLSPKWRSAIKTAGLGDGPADSNPDKLSKVAILMTDGQFNTAYAGVSGNNNAQGNVARSNAESLCSNMKADGIKIYTIGFDLDDKSMSPTERQEARSVLKDCASEDTPSSKHFFDVSTGPQLDQAFQAIIADTERLVLTQ